MATATPEPLKAVHASGWLLIARRRRAVAPPAYLSERQCGTVRKDYTRNGDA
jgi:hypothetical protein